MKYFVDGINAGYRKEYQKDDKTHLLTVTIPIGNDERGILYNEWGILKDESFDYCDIVYHIKSGKIIKKQLKNKDEIPVTIDFIENHEEYKKNIKDELISFLWLTKEIEKFSTITENDIFETSYKKNEINGEIYINFNLKDIPNTNYLVEFKSNGQMFYYMIESNTNKRKDLFFRHMPELFDFLRNYLLTKSKFRAKLLIDGYRKDA